MIIFTKANFVSGGECGNLCQSHASCCLSGHDAGCMYYLENGRAQEVRDLCMPIKEILELIPGTK